MKTLLSDKMKSVLADPKARQQLSDALAHPNESRTVTVGGKTYAVIFGRDAWFNPKQYDAANTITSEDILETMKAISSQETPQEIIDLIY